MDLPGTAAAVATWFVIGDSHQRPDLLEDTLGVSNEPNGAKAGWVLAAGSPDRQEERIGCKRG
jgi:hypothetical protein